MAENYRKTCFHFVCSYIGRIKFQRKSCIVGRGSFRETLYADQHKKFRARKNFSLLFASKSMFIHINTEHLCDKNFCTISGNKTVSLCSPHKQTHEKGG